MIAENQLPEGIRDVARVGPTASADEIAVGLLAERGLAAFDFVKYRIPDRGSSHSPGPIVQTLPRFARPPGTTLRMDPTLMRRYGLRIEPSAPKPAPESKPEK